MALTDLFKKFINASDDDSFDSYDDVADDNIETTTFSSSYDSDYDVPARPVRQRRTSSYSSSASSYLFSCISTIVLSLSVTTTSSRFETYPSALTSIV